MQSRRPCLLSLEMFETDVQPIMDEYQLRSNPNPNPNPDPDPDPNLNPNPNPNPNPNHNPNPNPKPTPNQVPRRPHPRGRPAAGRQAVDQLLEGL